MQGFTLIELLLVILLLSVMATTGVNYLQDNQFFERRFSQDELAGLLSAARRQAIRSGCPVELREVTLRQWALFQREQCSQGAYTRSDAAAPQIVFPPNVIIRAPLPLFFSQNGEIAHPDFPRAAYFDFLINGRSWRLDSWSGLFYAV